METHSPKVYSGNVQHNGSFLQMSFLTGGYVSTQALLGKRSSIKGGESEVAPRLHLPVHKGGNYGSQGPFTYRRRRSSSAL